MDTRSKGRVALSRGPWDLADAAVDASQEVEDSPTTADVVTQPIVVDWDHDGRLDLITADHVLPAPGAPAYHCRVWWQRNEGTTGRPRLGPRRPLTSFEDPGPAVGLDTADLDGTGRPGLLVAVKLLSPGRPFRTAVWFYPRRTGADP